MVDIRILSELELVKEIKQGQSFPDHLISIGNPRLFWKRRKPGEFIPPLFKGAFKRILRLQFFDCDSLDHLGEMRPKRIPELRDVKRVIRLYHRTRASATGYVVHCWGGISRSTAVARGHIPWSWPFLTKCWGVTWLIPGRRYGRPGWRH